MMNSKESNESQKITTYSEHKHSMRPILDSLDANICLLDENGYIEEINNSWIEFARANDADIDTILPGTNYLEICDNAEDKDRDLAHKFASGIRQVINGDKDAYKMEYPCHSPDQERWFMGRITPYINSQSDNKRKVVISHQDITAKKLAKRTETMVHHFLNNTIEQVIYLDTDMNIIWANRAVAKAVNQHLEDLSGKKCYEIWENSDGPCENCPAHAALETGQSVRREIVNSNHSYYVICSPVKSDKGKIVGVVETTIDITEQKKLKEQLNIKEQALDSSLNATALADEEGTLFYVNQSFLDLLGYKRENEVIGNSIFNFWEDADKAAEIFSSILEENSWSGDTTIRKKDNHLIEVNFSANLIYSQDTSSTTIGASFIDISDKVNSEAKYRYLSYHDNLTDLYNRTYLEEQMKLYDNKNYFPISIIMADVNGLKLINDTYGHVAGDELLTSTGDILTNSCRKADLIARWGGDEFVIFLTNTDEDMAFNIVKRIKQESANFKVKSISVNLALGTATKTSADENLEDIFKTAEDHMYQNKLTERNSVRSNIISAFLGTLKNKSDETEEHAMRMKDWAVSFGDYLDLKEEELNELSLLSTMHDIGKVTIPEEILRKPGKLTEEEWEIIKDHPETGQRIAHTSENLISIAEEILAHHERWDGSGYPNGLKGEEIPYLARIINIIDAYDVMTNGTSYQSPISEREALKEINRCSGSQFDPELAHQFIIYHSQLQ